MKHLEIGKEKGYGLDILKSVLMLMAASVLGIIFQETGFTDTNIVNIYILSVLIISVITSKQIYSLFASLASVIIFNFLFTEPKFTLRAYDPGYPVTFLVMLIASLITGTLATKLKESAKQSARTALRTQILFETDQLLGKVHGMEAITEITAQQLVKLLGRSICVFHVEKEELTGPCFYKATLNEEIQLETEEREKKAAENAWKKKIQTGAGTAYYPDAENIYFPVSMNENIYAVIGIDAKEKALESAEKSILLSILGECALALENEKNAREKEEAALQAENEKFRANLLRTISHDLRTPLTSISGNASNLITNSKDFDEQTKQALYTDIYDDSLWLINLVENLLAVSRIEEGNMNIRMSAELMDEVIREALLHVDRKVTEHTVKINASEELLLAKMDAHLIVQVIINIMNNAIKYTQKGSTIEISTWREKNWIYTRISDNGPGISKEEQQHIFEMFYSGKTQVADSGRSLGLGLALCKAIISAHGGTISVSDHKPQGTVFQFTLQVEEVNLNE